MLVQWVPYGECQILTPNILPKKSEAVQCRRFHLLQNYRFSISKVCALREFGFVPSLMIELINFIKAVPYALLALAEKGQHYLVLDLELAYR